MGMTATVAAKQNKLRINAEWRAQRRISSDAFLKAEQKSRDRYNEFTKLSREFSKAYPIEFKTFLMSKAEGRPVARQSFGLPRHMPPVAPHMLPITTAAGGLRPMPTVHLSHSGRIPNAQELENNRPKPAADMLAALGIRLD